MPGDELDWDACPAWDGEESSLPLGEQTRVPDFRAIDLVKRWEVLDSQEDAGFRVVKTAELQPSDKIIGAQINENSVNAIINTYGKRFFVAARADAVGKLLDRWEWYAAFGSDVIELEALKQIRQKRR